MTWPLMGETITFGDRLKMAYFTLTAKRFTNGIKVKQFEQEWNEWLGSKHSLYVSSGSTANFLLVAAVKELYKLKNGDKVLLPACTWVTNVAPIIQLGLKPVFCDINFNNYSFDLEHAKKLGEKNDIKLIFVTHLLGYPGDNDKLKKIFPSAIVIDDVCESHGCKDHKGVKVGSNSLGATFSFYFGHHMSTVEGGMVSTNNSQLYDLMKMKRSHGLARESINFDRYAKQNSHIDKQFLFMTDGYNFRNHEICAVLGSSQLKRLDKMIEVRNRNLKLFVDIVNKYENLFYPVTYTDNTSSFSLPFVCKSSTTMKRLKEEFAKNGIEFRPIVGGNLLIQPFLKDYSISKSTNVDILNNQGVYIGNSHFVTEQQVRNLETIIEKINEQS